MKGKLATNRMETVLVTAEAACWQKGIPPLRLMTVRLATVPVSDPTGQGPNQSLTICIELSDAMRNAQKRPRIDRFRRACGLGPKDMAMHVVIISELAG